MRFPLAAYFGLASQVQVPVNPSLPPITSPARMANESTPFALKEAADIFSPKDLVGLYFAFTRPRILKVSGGTRFNLVVQELQLEILMVI